MACAELLIMALLAALKKQNMTQEPIVMWLGNSSSPPRLIPWSSVNKSPGGGHGEQPKLHAGVSPEGPAKPFRPTSQHTLTSLAALPSHYRHPQRKKPGGPRKKKKRGGVRGPRKKKKNRKKKFRKGARNLRGGRGRSKRKGRKRPKGGKKPPRGKKQTTRRSQRRKSTRRRGSSVSPDGGVSTRSATRGRRRHPHSPGEGQQSQSRKPATKPVDVEHDKTGVGRKTTSLTWTSTSLKLEGTLTIGSRKPESNTPGASVRPGKATRKPHDGKEHSTLRTHGTGQPSNRIHQSTTKSKHLPGGHGIAKSAEQGARHKKHETHQGRPPASPHHGMLPKTQSSSPEKAASTNSVDKLDRKQGMGQTGGGSSQAQSEKSSAVTPSLKAESSTPTVAASQAPAQMRGKNSDASTGKPAESSGTTSAAGSAKTVLSSSPAEKTGSRLTTRLRDSKFGASAAVTTVSKARPPSSMGSSRLTRRPSSQTTSKGNGKEGGTTQAAPPHKKKKPELHRGHHHQRHKHHGSIHHPSRRLDVTPLLTSLRRLEQATKAGEMTTANKAALTRRPEAKDGQEASISPQAARLASSTSLSALLRTIPVKAPEASTSK
ncbi:mucin-21-like [Dermacentor albipictus]|uniref:mucin-21-like n=1 Tax=Dermacentor albipictus TaxID=60249 RepID=UPI0031FC6D87